MRQAVLEHTKTRQVRKKMGAVLCPYAVLLKEEIFRQQTSADELKIAFFKRTLKDGTLCAESVLIAEKIIKGV